MDMGADGDAVLSDCGTYRYALSRRWDVDLPTMRVILLNPSTADGTSDDPTVRRCIHRARTLGFGGLVILNLFALRATDPRALRRAADPVGPQNDQFLREHLQSSGTPRVLCGWGNHGHYLNRGADVLAMIRAEGGVPLHLGLTRSGAPRHPLYVGYGQMPLAL